MDRKELKIILRQEFKLKTGQYLTFSLGDEFRVPNEISAFDVDFCLNLKTYFFCKRSVKDGREMFSIEKVVTINCGGDVFTFKSFEEFLEYVKSLENVESVKPY